MDGKLTDDQVQSKQGCGAGTANACFALTSMNGEMQCSLITNPGLAQMAGVQLAWRVNIDENDGVAWCPLGVLANSKTE